MAASSPQDDIQTYRLVFVGNPTNRDTVTSKDQRFINAYFDVLKTADGNKDYFLCKRPGATRLIQPSGGSGTGRGVYVWKGDRYSVVGTKLYKNTTDLGVTLTTSTGLCGFAEVRPGAASQYLGINDGAKLYLIAATTGVVTTITSNFPNPNTGDLIYFDQYFFTFDLTGRIYQSNADDPTTWDSSKVINVQMYNGTGVGLAMQNNQLFAFTDRHMQGFYDAGNASGSVLTNVEQVAQQVGCASQQSIIHDESYVMWVSNTNSGGYAVMSMSGDTTMKQVSTPGIERILEAEGTALAGCIGDWVRICGHTFYILKLISQNRTLVYDVENDLWLEWQGTDGNALPFISYTQYQNTLIAQHATDGYLYTLAAATTQDNGANFTVFGRFKRNDLDDNRRKFIRRADLIGDVQSSTTNVSLQYSDDDYVTLSTARTMDMSQVRAFSSNLGNFRRRAWQISYTGSNPLRLQALELKIRLGGN